jgi:cytosine/adenosine deaminase-related metal-dependent hydrolase
MIQPNWEPKQEILQSIQVAGGWVNTHSHLDRSYTITAESLKLGNKHLHQKWQLIDELKRSSSVEQIYDRMAYALERQRQQGVTALLSFIDVDEVIKDKALQAASKLKQVNSDMQLLFANQTLKGVLEPEARKWFEIGAEFADVIGGLPAKDAGREAEHLDIILQTGKKLNKLVHVHVDQLNTAAEKETELLAKKTIEHSMQGRVVAIHSVSLAAHQQTYRQMVYQQLKKAQLMVITCPTAWIDARRSEELAPIHNAIAPVEELIQEGIAVGLGTDNIADIYKPFTDGEMWIELRFLLETCHYYELDKLVKIATAWGRKTLGLQ